jgi:hypothetical protein
MREKGNGKTKKGKRGRNKMKNETIRARRKGDKLILIMGKREMKS